VHGRDDSSLVPDRNTAASTGPDPAAIADSYDEIPYDSTPIYETHPASLSVPGVLFGLSPAPPEKCRYLEFGCASGGNLIPLAYHLPQSEFVGIERSVEQVRAGRELIRTLGLDNVRIELADVLIVPPDAYGQFDYITAHGFYSWVPPPVQQRMFAIIAASLAPHGIACVSYNTFPGWHIRGLLRDVLRFHVRDLASPRERLAAAARVLDQYEQILSGQDDRVSAQILEDVQRLRTRHPSYLYHEYLVDDNRPVLFRDFMVEAGRYGLQYLCESELHTMFGDNFPESGQAWIDSQDDIIDQEQAMDFLRQRVFSQTLLCRREIPVRRELDLDAFAGLSYHALLVPAEPTDLRTETPETFTDVDGGRVVVRHPLARAALQELASQYPNALSFQELSRLARLRIPIERRSELDDDELLVELVRLYLFQHVGVSLQAETLQSAMPARPRASKLARAQVVAGLGHIATRRHKPMGIDQFIAALVQRMDGTLDPHGLATALSDDLASGRLVVEDREGGRRVPGHVVAANVQRALAMLARHGAIE